MLTEIQQKTGKSVPGLGHGQRKESPRFSESVTADSKISSLLCGNYIL